MWSALSKILSYVESGSFSEAGCSVGNFITTLSCTPPAQAAAPSQDAMAPKVLTIEETRATCAGYCAKIKAGCDKNAHLVRTGMASDTAVPSSRWLSLALLIEQAIELFLKPQPAPPPAEPTPAPAAPDAPPAAPPA